MISSRSQAREAWLELLLILASVIAHISTFVADQARPRMRARARTANTHKLDYN